MLIRTWKLLRSSEFACWRSLEMEYIFTPIVKVSFSSDSVYDSSSENIHCIPTKIFFITVDLLLRGELTMA